MNNNKSLKNSKTDSESKSLAIWRFINTPPKYMESIGEVTEFWSIRGNDLFNNEYSVIIDRRMQVPEIMNSMTLNEHAELYRRLRRKMTEREYRLMIPPRVKLREDEFLQIVGNDGFEKAYLHIDPVFTMGTYLNRFGPEVSYVTDVIVFKKMIRPYKMRIDILQRWHNRMSSWVVNLDRIEEAIDCRILMTNWSKYEMSQRSWYETLQQPEIEDIYDHEIRTKWKDFLNGQSLDMISSKVNTPLIYHNEMESILRANALSLETYYSRQSIN